MVDITREEFWDSEYEKNSEEKEQKKSMENKIIIIGLTVFVITLTINIILIYNFFNLLNKI